MTEEEKRDLAEIIEESFINALRGVGAGGGGISKSGSYVNKMGARGDSLRDIFDSRYTKREAEVSKKDLEDILRRVSSEGHKEGFSFSEAEKNILEENGFETSDEALKNLQSDTEGLEKKIKSLNQTEKDCNFGSRLIGYHNIFKKIGSALRGIDQAVMGFVEPWAKADAAASKYAKTIGATKAGLESLRSTTIDNVVHSKIGIDFNVSTDELIQAQQNYVQGVGRSLRIDNDAQVALAAMHSVMGGKENELAVAFENFGIGLEKTGEHAGKMFDEAARSGISFEKYTDNVAKNIRIAQNYTFRNGINGLESMAKKAVALRMDMSQVASLADKVSSVEGSIDVASKLQVLGGQFASFADPLGMMSEGLLDMEGLMDRVTNMIGGLGNFDKVTGQVKVSAFNKQRIKAAAQAMGMDYGQLMESVNAQAKRNAIENEINRSSAAGLNEEMKELLKNSATFNKEGKAGVSINGEFRTLDQLTNEDYDTLVKETQSESADIKDIAKNVRSLYEIRSGFKKQREATQAKFVEKLGIGDGLKYITNALGHIQALMWVIVAWNAASTLMSSYSNIRSIFSMFGRKGAGRGFGNAIGKMFGGGGATAGGAKGFRGFANRISTRYTGRFAGKATGEVAAHGVTRGATSAGLRQGALRANEGLANLGAKLSTRGGLTGKAGNAMFNAAVKNEAKLTAKVATKTGVKAGVNAGVKAGVSAGAQAGIQTGARVGIQGAAGAVGAGVGIAGMLGNMYTDKKVASGEWEKGGTKHATGKVVSSAAEGAGWGIFGATLASTIATAAGSGSAVGPWGTVIGAVVGLVAGSIVGAVKVAKARREVVLDKQLEELGIQRKGDYGARSLKLIDKGLQTGEISDRMRKKLLRNGDSAILKQIQAKKAELEEQEEAKKDREAERQAKINGGEGKVSGKINKATFKVSKAYFGGQAFGEKGIDTGSDFGNVLVNGLVSSLNPLGMLSNSIQVPVPNLQIANPQNIAPIRETGRDPELEKLIQESKKKKEEEERIRIQEEAARKQAAENNNAQKEVQQQTAVPQEINGQIEIKFSGEIKLVGSNGKNIDITNDLLNDKEFRKQIENLVKANIKQNVGSGDFVQTFNKYNTFQTLPTKSAMSVTK